MWESAKLGPGWGGSGPMPGFFPFGLSLLLALGGGAAFIEVLLRERQAQPFFEDHRESAELFKVGIPIVLAIASLRFLGFYLMVPLYLGLFACWYGGFRWYVILPVACAFSYGLYMVLDQGFRIMMPKSPWYGGMLPF